MIPLDGLTLVSECIELPQVDSTNRMALDAERPGLLVIAREQTAGRGRRQRRWFSPPGENIYLSLTVEGVDPRLTLVAGVAVHTALAGLAAPTAVMIKWPNDILIDGKKVCGILCEARGGFTAIGIGVNVSQTTWPDEIKDSAITLASATGRAFTRDEVIHPILTALDRWVSTYRAVGFEPIRAYAQENGPECNASARLEDGTPCRIIEITSDGCLEVSLSGEKRIISSGDVFLDRDQT